MKTCMLDLKIKLQDLDTNKTTPRCLKLVECDLHSIEIYRIYFDICTLFRVCIGFLLPFEQMITILHS